MTAWITVTDQKRERRTEKFLAYKKEQSKWAVILEGCPHIMLPSRAKRLHKMLNVDGLYEKLMSDEWMEYQKQGWIYSKVIKPKYHEVIPENTEEMEYSVLKIDNGWGDTALFYRRM